MNSEQGNVLGQPIERTETIQSLEALGLSQSRPIPDFNYPSIPDGTEAEFPEEYTLETQTGLVPLASLEKLRSRNSALSYTREEFELEKDIDSEEDSTEYVTFTVNDPENPKNWSKLYKWFCTITVSMLIVAIAFGSSNVTGGLGLIEKKYDVSLEVAILTCSIMVCGFAVGPLLWAPLSEQIGRRSVYAISFTLYTIFNIPCALSPNIGGLLVCRFLCGVFASSGLSLAGGTIADIWSKEERGMAIAYFAAAPYCGPTIGPIVCGWINVGTGRLDLFFWVNLAFAGFMTLLVCSIPETYAPVILKRRAQKLRKETGNQNIMTEQEKVKMSLSQIIHVVLLRPLILIATEFVLDLMNMYIMLINSLLYAFFFNYIVIFTVTTMELSD